MEQKKIRKVIRNIVSNSLLSENYSKDILNDEYFKKRVPFFKYFINNSYDDTVQFEHYKNWHKKLTIPTGEKGSYMELPFASVETKFTKFIQKYRDFDKEDETSNRPLYKFQYHFIYSTQIHLNFENNKDIESEKDAREFVKSQIVVIMIKEILKDRLQFKESFIISEGEEIPKEKLNKIINDINKNLFDIDERISQFGGTYL